MANTSCSNDKRCGTCLPYNDGLVITAQVLSFIAITLSWNFFSFLFGFIAFVCLTFVWCYKMRKCGLITLGILTTIASIADIVIGCFIFAEGSTAVCNSAENYTDEVIEQAKESTYDDTAAVIYPTSKEVSGWFQLYCGPYVVVYAGVNLAAGLLWLTISFLIFYFACGNRFNRFNKFDEKEAQKKIVEVDSVEVVMTENERREHLGTPRAVTGFVTGGESESNV